MITARNVIYDYPGKRALNDVSFEITTGQITALVGPNGAGKTTLLRCMAALDEPFSGDIVIDDMNVHEHPREAHRITGYLSDFFGLYEQMTVEQSLTYMAWSHGLDGDKIDDKIDWVCGHLDLTDRLDQKAANLSRGLRQRLAIAQSILHEPKVLLLDEPASGLDPEARQGLSDLILALKDMGMTIIVSSHILAELEDYCTDMLVIRDGMIIDHVRMKDMEKSASRMIDIHVLQKNEEFLPVLSAFPGVSDVYFKDKDTISLSFDGNDSDQANLLKTLIEQEIPVASFAAHQKTLQDAYMSLSKKQKISPQPTQET